ncbi:hypothetical protein AGLY_005185 [Aphis glycines]|uniref:Uncharacterized protein n=1 Tax=Aphis glycines TaxID=307491 RepID=A0A6G0TYF5_APHGL|nr:hypothetical protein AGLY_005185 [Aphis glycines]
MDNLDLRSLSINSCISTPSMMILPSFRANLNNAPINEDLPAPIDYYLPVLYPTKIRILELNTYTNAKQRNLLLEKHPKSYLYQKLSQRSPPVVNDVTLLLDPCIVETKFESTPTFLILLLFSNSFSILVPSEDSKQFDQLQINVVPKMHFSNKCLPTLTSTAESGSSTKLILAFCPPLKVIPLSPTTVSWPSGKCSRSFFRAQTSITYLKIILYQKIPMVLVMHKILHHEQIFFLRKLVGKCKNLYIFIITLSEKSQKCIPLLFKRADHTAESIVSFKYCLHILNLQHTKFLFNEPGNKKSDYFYVSLEYSNEYSILIFGIAEELATRAFNASSIRSCCCIHAKRRILVYIYLYVMISKIFALHLGLEGRSTLLSAFDYIPVALLNAITPVLKIVIFSIKLTDEVTTAGRGLNSLKHLVKSKNPFEIVSNVSIQDVRIPSGSCEQKLVDQH